MQGANPLRNATTCAANGKPREARHELERGEGVAPSSSERNSDALVFKLPPHSLGRRNRRPAYIRHPALILVQYEPFGGATKIAMMWPSSRIHCIRKMGNRKCSR
jgi:hypothetical protein